MEKPIHSTITSQFNYTLTSLMLVAALITGIVFGYSYSYISLAIIAALNASMYAMHANKKYLLYICLTFLLGYARQEYLTHKYQKTVAQIEQAQEWIGEIVAIEEVQSKRHRFIIKIDISAPAVITKAHTPIPWVLHYYATQQPDAHIADIVKISNVARSKKATNSFSDYLKKEGVHATMFLSHKNNIEVLYRPKYSVAQIIDSTRKNLFNRIMQQCNKETATLIAAIFFGNRLVVKETYAQQKDLFCLWGIIHFLARSGLHLVMFVLFLEYIFRFIPSAWILRQACIICATIIYALLSWQSVSFERACFTFAWYSLCRLLQLQIFTTHIIVTLIALFLLYNPMLLFFLDFQLSFGLTLLLACINQSITAQKLSRA